MSTLCKLAGSILFLLGIVGIVVLVLQITSVQPHEVNLTMYYGKMAIIGLCFLGAIAASEVEAMHNNDTEEN